MPARIVVELPQERVVLDLLEDELRRRSRRRAVGPSAVLPTPIGPSTAMYRAVRSAAIPLRVRARFVTPRSRRVHIEPRAIGPSPMPTAVLRRSVAQLFMVGHPGSDARRARRARFSTSTRPAASSSSSATCSPRRRCAGWLRDLHALGAGVRADRRDRPRGRPRRSAAAAPVHPLPARRDGRRRTASPRVVAAVAEAMGRELSAIGIDLDFAPVLDVWANPRNARDRRPRVRARRRHVVARMGARGDRGSAPRRRALPAASTSPDTAARSATRTRCCRA